MTNDIIKLLGDVNIVIRIQINLLCLLLYSIFVNGIVFICNREIFMRVVHDAELKSTKLQYNRLS